jgi:hypothetical protein
MAIAMILGACHRLTPLLFGLARDSGCLRVFDFYPIIGPARAIGRAEALRHDALAAKRASLAIDDCAIRSEVLVEHDARMFAAQQRLQGQFACFNWRAPQILAVEFEQVERAEHGGGVMAVPADQVENGKSAFVADDGFAVDQTLAHRQHCQGGDDLREAVREVIAIGPSSLSAAHHFW